MAARLRRETTLPIKGHGRPRSHGQKGGRRLGNGSDRPEAEHVSAPFFVTLFIVRFSGAPERRNIIAQGKVASAPSWVTPTLHPAFFSSGLARLGRAKPEEKKETFCVGNPGRRAHALALG